MAIKADDAMSKAGRILTPQESIDQEILSQLRWLFRATKKHFHSFETKNGVSNAQLSVLVVISQKPGIRVNDIADALQLHQSTASNLIGLLVKQKLIRRQRGELDKRAVHVFIEAIGKQQIKRTPKSLNGILPKALARMSTADSLELKRLLATLIESIDA